ncbi:MAG: TonB-dependent receptor, partial [Bacteroidales bacterium]|nr:TonB-dependent receptor [Bacteroidales bacterium]
SYGRLGNQSGAGLYEYLGLMNVSTSAPDAWLLPGATQEAVKGTVAFAPSMISPHITWEKVDNADIGLDVVAFGNRMNLVFDVYQRVTRDMLGPAEAIPSFSGIAASDRARTNNATLRNRGWELSLSWTDRLPGGFRYHAGFNVFDYRAKVTAYSNPEGVISNNHTGLAANKGYYAGMDVGEIWGYKADRLFESDEEAALYPVDLSFFKAGNLWKAGDVRYEDVDGDGAVNPGQGTLEDHGDLVVIGNATPRFSFGINLSAGYKGLEVAALVQGVGKRDFPMAGSTYLFGGRNYFKDHLDRFSPENPSGWLPRLTDGTGSGDLDWKVNTGYNTSRYLLNGAYVRLKNLMVSYSFSGNVLGKLRLRDLKIYVSCDNLLTLDALPSAFDPETMNIVSTWAGGSLSAAPGLTSALSQNGNGKVYPLSRTMVMGVEIKF